MEDYCAQNLINYVKIFNIPKKETHLEDKHILIPVFSIKQKDDNKQKPNVKTKKAHKKNRCSSVDQSNLKMKKSNKNNDYNSSKDLLYMEPLRDNNSKINIIDDNNIMNYENEIKSKQEYIEKKDNKIKPRVKKDYNKMIIQLKNENSLLKRELHKTDAKINKYKKECENQEQIIKDLKFFINEMKKIKKPKMHLNKNESNYNKKKNYKNDILYNEGFQEQLAINAVEQKIIDEICPNPDAMTYEQLLQLEEKVGSVNKGLNIQQIEKLPITKYKKDKNNENYQCIICMEEFEKNEKINLLPCGHLFHINCIKQWLLKQKSCPFCKSEIG